MTVQGNGRLPEHVRIHAQSRRHNIIKLLPVLGLNSLVYIIVADAIELLELLTKKAYQYVHHKEAFGHEIRWAQVRRRRGIVVKQAGALDQYLRLRDTG